MSPYRLSLICADRPGLVAELAVCLAEHGADITGLDEHAEAGHFALRVSFLLPDQQATALQAHLAERFPAPAQLRLRAPGWQPRVALLASRQDHCLQDLLWRFGAGELPGQVVQVAATVREHQPLCAQHRVPFAWMPVRGREAMPAHEGALLELLRGRVDVLVLARYMRILSGDFLRRLGLPVINIHHSFLPAFVGSDPYQQAHQRGVKLIGATAHYVVEELDAGPIIEQDVLRVAHHHGPEQLQQLGRDVERVVLARAVRAHLEDRVATWENRTVVFP